MFTTQHVVYVTKQLPSLPKMFTNERLFTIQAFTITRVHCITALQQLYLAAPSEQVGGGEAGFGAHAFPDFGRNKRKTFSRLDWTLKKR